MTEQIFERALELLNRVCENTATLEAAAEAACRELAGRLRKSFMPEDIEELFVAAGAVLALSMYLQLSDLGAMASFKAGDLSVSKRGERAVRSNANALRRQAEAMLLGFLVDRDFQFRGVRG